MLLWSAYCKMSLGIYHLWSAYIKSFIYQNMSPDGIIDRFIPDVMAKDHKNILHTFHLVENSQLLDLNWICAKFTIIYLADKLSDEYAYTCRAGLTLSVSVSVSNLA